MIARRLSFRRPRRAYAATRAGELPYPQSARLAIGAVLFFISDLAVARGRFVADTFTNKAWGLPTYFGGQLLIAWSVLGS